MSNPRSVPKSHPRPVVVSAGEPGRARPPFDPDAHPLRLYRPRRLAHLLDVDESTVWRWRKSGVLPPPVEIGGVRGWTEAQLQAVFARRREAADA